MILEKSLPAFKTNFIDFNFSRVQGAGFFYSVREAKTLFLLKISQFSTAELEFG